MILAFIEQMLVLQPEGREEEDGVRRGRQT